jgi:hypothetical protein
MFKYFLLRQNLLMMFCLGGGTGKEDLLQIFETSDFKNMSNCTNKKIPHRPTISICFTKISNIRQQPFPDLIELSRVADRTSSNREVFEITVDDRHFAQRSLH